MQANEGRQVLLAPVRDPDDGMASVSVFKKKAKVPRKSKASTQSYKIEEEVESDTEALRKALIVFFPVDETDESKEQLQSAETRFLEAVEHGSISPYVAFKEVISTTVLSRDMDTLHATKGGIDYYMGNYFHVSDRDRRLFSTALKAEAAKAGQRRKIEEIKRLMNNKETEDISVVQDIKLLCITDEASQGQENQMETD